MADVNIGGALPVGDANGLTALASELIDNPARPHVMIIGRHRTEGTLVRAVSEPPYIRPFVGPEDLNPDLPEKPTLCRSVMGWSHTWSDTCCAFFDGTEIEFGSGAYQDCGIDGHFGRIRNRCELHDNGHAPEIEAVIAWWYTLRNRHSHMRELPLIVLAGLR